MLLEWMQETRNFFLREVFKGVFFVEGGTLSPLPEGLLTGQYIVVTGSIFCDGLYKLGEDGQLLTETGEAATLPDEAFTGAVYALAVPQAVIALCGEIAAWRTSNPAGAAIGEQFGNYSYTRAQGRRGVLTWQEAFADRLTPYRRMFKEVGL